MSLRLFNAIVFQIPIVVIALALLAGCAEHPPTPVAQPPAKSQGTLVHIKRIDGYCLAVGALNFDKPYTRHVGLATCNDQDPAQQWHYTGNKEIISEMTDPRGERLMLYGMDIEGGRPSVWVTSPPSVVSPSYRWEHDAQRNTLTTQVPAHAGLALTVSVEGYGWLDPRGNGRVTQNFTIAPIHQPAPPLVHIRRVDGYCLAVGAFNFDNPYTRHVGLATCDDQDPTQQWRYTGNKEIISEITDPRGERLMLYGMDIVGGRPSVWVTSPPSAVSPSYRWEHDAQRKTLTTQVPAHAGLALTVSVEGYGWLDPWVNGRVTQNFTIAPIQ